MDSDPGLELLLKVCRRGRPPVPPATLRLALAMFADDSANTHRLIEQLDSEHALRFGLLALANLQAFPTSRPIKTVRDAILQRGRKHCESLLWVLALSRLLQQHSDLHPRARDKLWRHSVLTGVLAWNLFQAAGCRDLGDPFAAGMAHDVGHLLMADPAPRLGILWHEEHDTLMERQPSPAPDRDHCRLGSSLMRFWAAPGALAAVALSHHDPASADPEWRPLVAGVRLADLLAEYVDQERPAHRLRLDSAPAWKAIRSCPPWNGVAGLECLAISCLPASLLETEHLTNLLGV